MGKKKTKGAEPLLRIDRAARKWFEPYRETAPVKALRWFGQSGDQLQLRVLAGAVLAAGIVRGDTRMARAAVHMLVSHELATLAKSAVKHRVDRWRPNSAGQGKDAKPRPGHSKAKTLNSFPSGHSAGAMAVACAFATEYPEYRVSALTLAGAVCVAQVPTLSHYPSDVAAGASIGVATERALGLAWRMMTRALRRVAMNRP